MYEYPDNTFLGAGLVHWRTQGKGARLYTVEKNTTLNLYVYRDGCGTVDRYSDYRGGGEGNGRGFYPHTLLTKGP